MNKITLIVSLLLCASIAYAQSWSNDGFTPGQEVGYEQNGNTVWKLTLNNIYKSTNGGSSWTQGIDADSAPFYAEDYLPSEFGTFYPIFDGRDSRVFGDFMFLSLRTDFSNREYWTTPDAGQTFNKFEFDADFFSEAYDLGDNRYMVQVADYDNSQPSFYRCKWFYSGDGGQSFTQVIFDYGRNSRIIGHTNTSFIIHDMDKIYYRNFSNFVQTNVITLPEECEMVRVEGNLIQAASYDVANSQTATAFTLFTSMNGGGSFTSETSTKPDGFQFEYSVIDNYLFFADFDLYRYDLNNFSAGPVIFPGETYPPGPFKKTLDGRVVNSKPKNFTDPFFVSSNYFDSFQSSARVPYATEGLVEFDNTFGRIYGSDTYTTSDGITFQQSGDFFGSGLKSDLVYLDKSMSLSLYADPSSTSYFTNDGFNFETTNEVGVNVSNFAGDAAYYQAGSTLIADPVAVLDRPELFTSANNGNSWSIIPDSYSWGRKIFTDHKTGTLYGYSSPTNFNSDFSPEVYLSRSDDNGVTWRFIENGISNVSNKALSGRYGRPLMAYNNHIFFRDENRLLLSSDGGVSFSEVSLPNSFQDACVWIDNDKLHVSTKDEKLYVSQLDQFLANPAPRQAGYQVDLELSISTVPENPAPFSDFDVVVTIKNNSNQIANNIFVRRPFLSQPVAVNRGDEEPTYTGAFNWTNGSNNSLAPGETSTASYPYYRLDGGEIQTQAWIASALQPDVDSRYGAIQDLDNPEDDEAVYPAPNANGFTILVNCPDNVFKQETTSTPPMGSGFTGYGDVILPRPTATTTCPGGIISIEYVGTAPTFQMGGDLWLDGPGEYAIFWEIKDACGNIETCLYSAEVDIPSFIYEFANCPNDIVIDATPGQNGAIVTYSLQVNSDCPDFVDVVSITQGLSSGSFFPIGTTPVTIMATNDQCGTASCSFNVTVVAPTSGSGVDLELSMTQSVTNPVAFNTFDRTVTITNTGTSFSSSIRVSIPIYEGMVFSGGEEFVASRGFYNAYGDQVWDVGSLGSGQSESIVITYYALENITAPGYAQVTNSSGQDIDSTPNNGTPPTVNEDDEASTSGSTVVPLFWENCPTDVVLTAPAGSSGLVVNYTNPTLNTTGCPFLISNSGNNFESGSFFPIGTSTVTIFAGNPQCGTVECSFSVTIEEADGGAQGIDLELNMTQSTATPNAFTTFSRVVEVTNRGTLPANNIEIEIPLYAGMVFSGGEEFTASKGSFNPYATQKVWSISQIASGETATIILRYFSLQTINTAGYAQVISMDGQDIDSTPNNGTPPTVNEDDEASTNGGGISFPNLPDLTVSNVNISNTLFVGEFTDYSFDLNNFGSLTASADYTIDLFLRNNATNVNIFIGDVNTGNTFPGTIADVNAQIFIPAYVQDGAYTLVIETDADNVIMELNENNNTVTLPVQLISSTLPSADIELSVEQISLASRYNTYTIAYTASNNGNIASNDVQVSIPVPSGVVLSGGDEFDATKGTLGIYADNVWRIGSLSPGETVEMDINYYKLTFDNISHYAQVSFSAENDGDSTPNNGTCCTAMEDDEASLTAANSAAARTFETPNIASVSETAMEIYPNPASGSMVNLDVYSTAEKEQKIYIYDLLGRVVSTQQFYLYEGENKLNLSIQTLSSGMYQVVLQEKDRPATIKKLVIEK